MARRSPRPPLKNPAFEQALDDLSTKLAGLQERYRSICADQARIEALQQDIQRSIANSASGPAAHSAANSAANSASNAAPHAAPSPAPTTVDPELVATLEDLQRELDTLEAEFEAQFISWDGIGTLFWQVVRFGGLGVVLGWWLRSLL